MAGMKPIGHCGAVRLCVASLNWLQAHAPGTKSATKVMNITRLFSVLALVASGSIAHAGFASRSGSTLLYGGGTGEANDVTVDLVGSDLVLTDLGAPITPNPGDGFTVISANEVRIPAALISFVLVYTYDLDDRIVLTPAITLPSDLRGGDGSDIIQGGSGPDHIRGERGADILNGGAGLDSTTAEDDADMIATDTTLTVVGDATDSITSIELVAFQGGPSANLFDASAVTAASGISVELWGRGGNDTLLGGGGNDGFRPGSGGDFIDGGPGLDSIIHEQDTDMTLSDTQLCVAGDACDTFVNIEFAALIGGASDNVIDASQVTAATGISL